MEQYVAFLRGVNVGGNNLISMAALKDCLLAAGMSEVSAYIQSGNLIFRTPLDDKAALAARITSEIRQVFGLDVATVVFRGDEWRQVIATAPAWWGADATRRHNALILLQPDTMQQVVAAIGPLKPDLEALHAGAGVLYQSIALNAIGRGVTGSKLISNPVYRQLTIRNYNTSAKLAALLA